MLFSNAMEITLDGVTRRAQKEKITNSIKSSWVVANLQWHGYAHHGGREYDESNEGNLGGTRSIFSNSVCAIEGWGRRGLEQAGNSGLPSCCIQVARS